jgi:cathepsin B
MKVAIICLALVAVAAAVSVDAPIHDDEFISSINAANAGWTAGKNAVFEGKTYADIIAMLGALPSEMELDMPTVEYDTTDLELPEEFNGYKEWGKCAHPIRNQQHCGSCWAFGAAESLTDRFCIEQQVDVVLSPQDLVSCDHGNMGCNGGWLNVAWNYMTRTGVVSDECMPYTSGDGDSGKCPSSCTGSGEWKKYHAASSTHIARNEQVIQNELMTNGPMEVAFTVYQDFIHYTGGVYKHTSGSQLGGHAVKLMGWGVDNGTKYWLIANSWSTGWGEDGNFRILRGHNECGIEGDVTAGKAGRIE